MISKEISKSLKDHKITAEQYYILELLSIDADTAIDYVRGRLKSRNNTIQNLYRRGFIEIDEPDTENIGWSSKISISGLGKKAITGSADMNWFGDWYNLWPSGVKSGGYYLKSGEADCRKKMEKFLSKYDYTPEQIMKATSNYLNQMAAKGYEYTKLASYFIDKDGVSTLAGECENLNTSAESQSFIRDV